MVAGLGPRRYSGGSVRLGGELGELSHRQGFYVDDDDLGYRGFAFVVCRAGPGQKSERATDRDCVQLARVLITASPNTPPARRGPFARAASIFPSHDPAR